MNKSITKNSPTHKRDSKILKKLAGIIDKGNSECSTYRSNYSNIYHKKESLQLSSFQQNRGRNPVIKVVGRGFD